MRFPNRTGFYKLFVSRPGRCGFLTNAEYQTRILPDSTSNLDPVVGRVERSETRHIEIPKTHFSVCRVLRVIRDSDRNGDNYFTHTCFSDMLSFNMKNGIITYYEC